MMATRRDGVALILGVSAVVVCIVHSPVRRALIHWNLSVNPSHGLVIRPDRIVYEASSTPPRSRPLREGFTRHRPRRHDVTRRTRPVLAGRNATHCAPRSASPLTASRALNRVVDARSSFAAVRRRCRPSASSARSKRRSDASVARSVVFADSFLADRVGWHEITAVGDVSRS